MYNDNRDELSYGLTFKTPKQYINGKLSMLRSDMYIDPTDEELSHLKSLKTEGDIDRAVKDIIDRHWRTYI